MGMKDKEIIIIALRNEKGSYNKSQEHLKEFRIIALRNEKGSYNVYLLKCHREIIIAL